VESKVDFEILCQDDHSRKFLQENERIKTLKNARFFCNDSNLGRGKNINLLNQKSQFNYLLILDCDTFPKDSYFIKNYLGIIQKGKTTVTFGGILYDMQKPKKEQLLRWVYGRKREATLLKQRIKNPYKNALTSNLLVAKNVFTKYPFDNAITKYGYEDLCFLNVLEANEIPITHIENPTYHLNLETSILFLSKTKTALENLLSISKANSSIKLDSKIIKTYKILCLLKMDFAISILFQRLKLKLEQNLTSKKPSLILFDCYKIGYFCYLNSK
jgi:hypothetical protein